MRQRNANGQFESVPIEQSFWECVAKDGPWMPKMPNRCWVWIGGVFPNGYSQLRGSSAHRFSYELHNAKIPEGKQIDHLCRIRLCVNPEHLEVVTARENMMRGKNRPIVEAKKAFCKRGHALTEANRIAKTRECKICSYNRRKLWGRKNRAAKRLTRNR